MRLPLHFLLGILTLITRLKKVICLDAFFDSTATSNGDGTRANPFNSFDSALTSVNTAGGGSITILSSNNILTTPCTVSNNMVIRNENEAVLKTITLTDDFYMSNEAMLSIENLAFIYDSGRKTDFVFELKSLSVLQWKNSELKISKITVLLLSFITTQPGASLLLASFKLKDSPNILLPKGFIYAQSSGIKFMGVIVQDSVFTQTPLITSLSCLLSISGLTAKNLNLNFAEVTFLPGFINMDNLIEIMASSFTNIQLKHGVLFSFISLTPTDKMGFSLNTSSFIGISNLNKEAEPAKGLIVNIIYPSPFPILIIGCAIIDSTTRNSFIFLRYNQKGIIIAALTFTNNVAAEGINIQYSVYVDMRATTFSKNNQRTSSNSDYKTFAGPCISLMNMRFRNLVDLKIEDSISYLKVPGILVSDLDVAIFASLPAFPPAHVNLTTSVLRNNFLLYSQATEVGAALYINTKDPFNITLVQFLNNTVNSTSKTYKLGGPCINAENLFSTVLLLKSILKGNRARYYSNCIQYLGYGLQIVATELSDNNPFLDSSMLPQAIDSKGGAIYFQGDVLYMQYAKIINNTNYMGGAVYIQGHPSKTSSSFFSLDDNLWQDNTAEYEGGSVFFGHNIVKLNCTFFKNTFLMNWAKKSGGVFIAKFSDATSVITIAYSLFSKNIAANGGVGSLEYQLGLVQIFRAVFDQNYGTMMPKKDALERKLPPADDLGSGGVFNFLGRIFTYLQCAESNFTSNWAALRGGVHAGQCGNSTYFMCLFAGNNARIAGTAYANIVAFVYFVYSQLIGEFAENAASVYTKEFSLIASVGSVFRNCYSTKKQGAISAFDDGIIYIDNTKFYNVSSGEGSVIYIVDCLSFQGGITNIYAEGSRSPISLITIIDSENIGFVNGTFVNNNAVVFFVKHSKIAFINLKINNNDCSNLAVEGCGYYIDEESQVYINYTFINATSAKLGGGGIYVKRSMASINFGALLNVKSEEYGGCLVGIDSQLMILGTSFKNFQGGCIYTETSQVNFTMNTVDNTDVINDSHLIGSSFYAYNNKVSYILSSVFKNNVNNTVDGAAGYFENNAEAVSMGVIIIKSNFSDNSAKRYGGALTLKLINATLQSNLFNGNTAIDGGAIYFDNYYKNKLIGCLLVTNAFLKNVASRDGGAIKYTSQAPIDFYNKFSFNMAPYGNDTASYPVRIIPLTNLTKGENVTGKNISNTSYIVFELVDNLGQRVMTLNKGVAEAFIFNYTSTPNSASSNSSTQSFISISGETERAIYEGRFNFSGLKFFAYPAKINITLGVKTDEISEFFEPYLGNLTSEEIKSGESYEWVMNVPLRSCIRGEVYDHNIHACQRCDYRKYSLNPSDTECTVCTAESINCTGGDEILLFNGYWRSSVDSLEIHVCEPNKESCEGGPTGKCKEGYEGPLCQSCSDGYAKSGLTSCVACKSNVVGIIEMIALGSAIFSLYIFMIYTNVNKLKRLKIDEKTQKISDDSKNKMLMSIYFRIFLNYLQVVSLAKGFDLEWPDTIKELFAVQFSMGNVSEQVYSIRCFQSNKAEVPEIYLKALMTAVTPFIFALVILIFWWAIKTIKQRSVIDDLSTSLLIALNILQPTVINSMSQLISCKEIDKGKFYIRTSLDYECYSSEHNKFVYAIAYPSLGLWISIYPLCLLLFLRKHKKELEQLKYRRKLGFLYNGYKTETYFWEFVIMYRKIAIIFVAVFLEYNTSAKALLVLLILAFSIYTQALKKPYFTKDLNDMEFRSIVVSISTIYFGLFFYSSKNDFAKVLMIVIIIAANIYFLYFWLLRVMATQFYALINMLQGYPRIQAIFKRLKEDYNKIQFSSLTRNLTRKRNSTAITNGKNVLKMETAKERGSVNMNAINAKRLDQYQVVEISSQSTTSKRIQGQNYPS